MRVIAPGAIVNFFSVIVEANEIHQGDDVIDEGEGEKIVDDSNRCSIPEVEGLVPSDNGIEDICK